MADRRQSTGLDGLVGGAGLSPRTTDQADDPSCAQRHGRRAGTPLLLHFFVLRGAGKSAADA